MMMDNYQPTPIQRRIEMTVTGGKGYAVKERNLQVRLYGLQNSMIGVMMAIEQADARDKDLLERMKVQSKFENILSYCNKTGISTSTITHRDEFDILAILAKAYQNTIKEISLIDCIEKNAGHRIITDREEIMSGFHDFSYLAYDNKLD